MTATGPVAAAYFSAYFIFMVIVFFLPLPSVALAVIFTSLHCAISFNII